MCIRDSHAIETEIMDRTAIKATSGLSDLLEDDTEGTTHLATTKHAGVSVNLPDVREPQYLPHRRLCHIGHELIRNTAPAVDGMPAITRPLVLVPVLCGGEIHKNTTQA